MEDSKPIDRAGEVLVLDSSTFIEEAGLTSKGASALKHYLYRRGTQLVVLQVVAEECESKLAEIAKGKKQKAEECLGWLARFCDGVGGWRAPSDDEIEERAKLLLSPSISELSSYPKQRSSRSEQSQDTEPSDRPDIGVRRGVIAESGSNAWICSRTMMSFSFRRTGTFAVTACATICTRNYKPKPTTLVQGEA